MGQILHGSATTTHAIRAAIQRSKAPLKELAARYGLNRKTVAKWRKRSFRPRRADGAQGPALDRAHRPRRRRMAVAFRKHTLLPLDDCLYALQATIPHLTRSSLHRCFQRHGISRLPEIEGDKAEQEALQGLPARLLPYRHRRGPDRGRQALPLRGRRPDLQVRLRPAAKKANGATARAFLTARRRRALRDPHGANGQRLQFADLPKNRMARPPGCAATPSTASAGSMASNIA